MYKVSLIIPVYNVAEFIEQSLLSALNQSFDSIEYVLIDDCGTDNSMELVQKVINKHPRKGNVFIYKHAQNQGLSAARNTGLQKATGEYIYFMDSDDEITSDCVELHYSAIEKYKADFTVGFIKLLGTTSQHIVNNNFGLLKERNILYSFLKGQFIETAWNKLYRKSFLLENELSFVPGLLHEDILWGISVSKAALKLVCVPKETYLYKVRFSSITTARCSMKRLDSYTYIIEQILFMRDKCALDVQERELYANYISKLQIRFALLLQISELTYSDRKKKYNHIVKLKAESLENQAFVLKLPYFLFILLFNIPYRIYKHFK